MTTLSKHNRALSMHGTRWILHLVVWILILFSITTASGQTRKEVFERAVDYANWKLVGGYLEDWQSHPSNTDQKTTKDILEKYNKLFSEDYYSKENAPHFYEISAFFISQSWQNTEFLAQRLHMLDQIFDSEKKDVGIEDLISSLKEINSVHYPTINFHKPSTGLNLFTNYQEELKTVIVDLDNLDIHEEVNPDSLFSKWHNWLAILLALISIIWTLFKHKWNKKNLSLVDSSNLPTTIKKEVIKQTHDYLNSKLPLDQVTLNATNRVIESMKNELKYEFDVFVCCDVRDNEYVKLTNKSEHPKINHLFRLTYYSRNKNRLGFLHLHNLHANDLNNFNGLFEIKELVLPDFRDSVLVTIQSAYLHSIADDYFKIVQKGKLLHIK